jgi:hypothetical protein
MKRRIFLENLADKSEADEYVSITNSDRYYDIVARTLNASTAELDEFYRYFRVSGLGKSANLSVREGGRLY